MSLAITKHQFDRHMTAARLLRDTHCCIPEAQDYIFAYLYGLRRRYHGERFGSDAEVLALLHRGSAFRDGFNDGLSGKAVEFSRLDG